MSTYDIAYVSKNMLQIRAQSSIDKTGADRSPLRYRDAARQRSFMFRERQYVHHIIGYYTTRVLPTTSTSDQTQRW